MFKTIKRFLVISSLVLVLVFVTGCSQKEVRLHNSNNLMASIEATNPEEVKMDEEFYNAQMNLSAKLFQKAVLEKPNENVMISPLSILLALGMVTNGSDGETKKELESLIGNKIEIEKLNKYIYSYVKSLPNDKKYRFHIANSIWYKDISELEVKKEFLETNANYYNAQAYKSKFDLKTLKDINKWVKFHTSGMIDKILDEISPDDLMFLVNALSFEAEWEVKYKRANIDLDIFTNIKGDKKEVKMMFSKESRFIYDDEARGFIKPYKDNQYSFVAILPDEGVEIGDYINNLSQERLNNLFKNEESRSIHAYLPKFSFEYESSFVDILKSLGINKAFSPSEADFSKMATMTTKENIYISEIIHKTFIDVNESKTKAAAVTIISAPKSAAPVGGEYITIRLDRPFIYMIVDNKTNMPLFIGTVKDI